MRSALRAHCYSGKFLHEHLKLALVEAAKQVEQYLALTEVLEHDAPKQLKDTYGRVKNWEANGQKGDDCPYETPQPGECGRSWVWNDANVKEQDLTVAQLNREAKEGISASAELHGEAFGPEAKAQLEWLTLGMQIEDAR